MFDVGREQARRALWKKYTTEQTDRGIVGDRRSAGGAKYRAPRFALGSIASRSLGQLSPRTVWQGAECATFSVADQTAGCAGDVVTASPSAAGNRRIVRRRNQDRILVRGSGRTECRNFCR